MCQCRQTGHDALAHAMNEAFDRPMYTDDQTPKTEWHTDPSQPYRQTMQGAELSEELEGVYHGD